MTFHRKVGGIHFFAIGPYRLSVCRTQGRTRRGRCTLPRAMPLEAILASVDLEIQSLPRPLPEGKYPATITKKGDNYFITYTSDERNHFIF